MNNQTAVVTFGRFQPAHVGHDLIVDTMRLLAHGDPFYIFTSHTHDSVLNPLTYEEKLKYLDLSYPDATIVNSDTINNPFQMLRFFNGKVKKVLWVVGSDRYFDPDLSKMFPKYHNHPDPSKALTFDFCELVWAGKFRNSFATSIDVKYPTIDHISGSLMRHWALESEYTNFFIYAPIHLRFNNPAKVYDLYMNIKRSLSDNANIPRVPVKKSSHRKESPKNLSTKKTRNML